MGINPGSTAFESGKKSVDQEQFSPTPIAQIEDTGLPTLWLMDHVLKIIYFHGYLTGFQLAEIIALPFLGVIDRILENLKREKLVEVRASTGAAGEGGYPYGITSLGIDRAREAIERSHYAGPAPVPLESYSNAMHRQFRRRMKVTENEMRKALSSLVISEETLQRLGPAVNSGSSVFMFGPSGNGKTTVANAIGKLILSQTMYIPYAIYVDGQVIKVYDSHNHRMVADNPFHTDEAVLMHTGMAKDARWLQIYRPFVMVGGELTLEGLDLIYNDVSKFYEAPFQVKANGGILLIDDFGRQLVRPRDLLNRWIVPLENRVDYLTLNTGRKLEIPFDVLVIFSTNLPPKELADEAFLRRMRHKVEIGDPSYEEYREIFRRVALAKGVEYNDQGLAYLLQEWYIKKNRKLRATHPRDLCDQIKDISQYEGIKPTMSRELLDQAAKAYFVDL